MEMHGLLLLGLIEQEIGRDYSPPAAAHPSRGPLGNFVACTLSRATASALVSNVRPTGGWFELRSYLAKSAS